MKSLSIQEAINKGKGEVSIKGWVYRERGSSQLKFIVLRDSTNIVQCVIKKEEVGDKKYAIADKIQIEASIEISGTIKEDKRAPTGYEILVKDFTLVGPSDSFPINKDQSPEFLADNKHLSIRSRRNTAILKVRSTVFGAIHEYFRKNNFYEYQSPSFTATAAEGGSTLFKVDYFGKPMYLTQTWQLYAEAGIFALEKIYCIAPSFRAERSKTSRHLTEYWHAEMEVAWAHFDDILRHGEGVIKHIFSKVLENNKKELELLGRDIKKLEPVINKKFPRIKYEDALKILKDKAKMIIPYGKDMRTGEEDALSKLYDIPIFITHYPKEIKAFYMKEDDKDKNVVLGSDLVAPEGYGEIIGASERETDLKELIRKLKAQGEDPERYSWYLDTRRYGSVPHAGFGLGVERVIAWICGLDNIKDAIPFPRTMLRYKP